MNIFYIHEDPTVAPKMMTDKHIVKMILESAQMLSTAHRVLDGEDSLPVYKQAYVNHPSTKWVRQSTKNYAWLYSHFIALSLEYSARYKGRVHSTYAKLHEHLANFPKNLQDGKFTQPPCAMPDIYKVSDRDHIMNYRLYYLKEKIKTEKDLDRFLSLGER
jgi:hypothetical protein